MRDRQPNIGAGRAVNPARVWVATGMLSLAGCAERTADDDEPEAEPNCMVLPASGHWNDGSQRVLQNEWGTVGTVCLCLTQEERWLDEVRWEMNEMGYEECERIAKLFDDFDWTECQQLYEEGAWLPGVFVATGDVAWMNHRGLTCGDEAPACSLHDPAQRSAMGPSALLAVLALLGLQLALRRRETG